jgi:hypothetical protein
MKTTSLLILILSFSAASAEQKGVAIEGVSVSRYLRATLSGDSVNKENPTAENQAFSQADVALKASPGGATGGEIDFRLHQDWSRYYDEGPNPFAVRRVLYSGSIFGDRVHFSMGDFRTRYSPLTLYSPAPEITMEPEIFAARRREAMDEWRLDSNLVPLQGLNAEYAAVSKPSFDLSFRATGARLRSVDPEGFLGWNFQSGSTEKWLAGGAFKATLWQGLQVGLTQMRVFDLVKASRAGNNAYALAERGTPLLTRYDDENVTAPMAGFDANPFLKESRLSFSVSMEYAFSSYSSSQDSLERSPVAHKVADLDDKAQRANLRAGFGKHGDDFSISLDADYLNTGADYVNDVAQSPTFIGRRILNSQSPIGGMSQGYSTLDALYNHEYHVAPITNLNTSEYWGNAAGTEYNGTNNWIRAPFFKNSYTPVISSKSERDSLLKAMDPNVQLLFPFGPATPNRAGFTSTVTGEMLKGALKAELSIASLKEIKGVKMDSLQAQPAAFARLGGGLALDLGAWFGLSKALRLSASYVKDSETRAAFTSRGVTVAALDYGTAFTNLGVYSQVLERLAFSAGYQGIKANPLRGYSAQGQTMTPVTGDQTQSQWSIGAELKVAAGAVAVAEMGMLKLAEADGTASVKQSQFVSGVSLRIGF